MLEDLIINDFVLIQRVHLEFTGGFNVLTGETGAGKSMLIGALSFLLGGKADASLIRSGCSEASVSATIFIAQNQVHARSWLNEHGIQLEENRILLRRIIRDSGKSASWIGDAMVTKNDVAEFTSFLVDIHGQHEHQSLMKVSEHRKFLDAYAGITDDVANFTKLYASLVEKRRALQEMDSSDTARNEKKELLQFAIEEIENAKLKIGEEEELSAEEARLSQYEKLYGEIELLCDIFHSGDASCLQALKKARTITEKACLIDTSLEQMQKRLENVFYEIDDLAEELRSYKANLVFDPARLTEVQERLALLYKLKKKYVQNDGGVQEILNYCENAKAELELLNNFENNKDSLVSAVKELEKKVYASAKALSIARNNAASEMGKKIEEVLATLGMKGARFDAGVSLKSQDEEGLQKCGPYGFDTIEFLISANPGSPLKPLARIASGGELSRVMLALKTILADTDTTPTLVFDEIDTGIGGEVAVAIGTHIKKLAQKHQILCISHLANIAVCADNHIRIQKSFDGAKNTTLVNAISGNERVEEIARMLAGDSASAASLEHAKELLARYSSV